MKQEEQYRSGFYSRRRPPVWQYRFWGFFWPNSLMAIPQLFWLVPTLMYFWWHIPFYFPLLILLVGYIVLMITAWRYYRQFRRARSLPASRKDHRGDQPHPSERSLTFLTDPQFFSQDHAQFHVPYPEQE